MREVAAWLLMMEVAAAIVVAGGLYVIGRTRSYGPSLVTAARLAILLALPGILFYLVILAWVYWVEAA